MNVSGASAVLLSGGLDSAVLLGEEAARGDVHPIYVSVGLAWERAERGAIGALLAAWPEGLPVRPLKALSVDMSDIYPAAHWAMSGLAPAYHTPDEDVYLLGRNLVLLGKASVFCASVQIDRLVLGTLGHNPFPDATPEFRAAMSDAASRGLGHRLTIEAPYAHEDKAEVIRRGAALGVPLELTLSCMSPPSPSADSASRAALHCGICSKCRERHVAFVASGIADTTKYLDRRFVDGRR
jgi:7-cyano-7-deazaguanine synthase